jgi:hypothetical protein
MTRDTSSVSASHSARDVAAYKALESDHVQSVLTRFSAFKYIPLPRNNAQSRLSIISAEFSISTGLVAYCMKHLSLQNQGFWQTWCSC